MSIVFAILLFSFLIFIHELGHFVAAKLSGVQVNEFALFMGPAIWQKQIGETLYSLRCIPIGGYCAMEGEDGESEDPENPRSFQKVAWWKRLIILVAGAFMNLVTGVLIFCIVFLPTAQLVEPIIASFEDCCVLEDAGLQVGDRFLQVDGEPIYVNSDVTTILSIKGGTHHDLVVQRNGETVALSQVPMVTHSHTNEDGTETVHYGFSFTLVEPDLGRKLEYVWQNVLNTVRNVRLSLQMLLTGQAGLQDVSGPVGIVSMMSDVAEQSSSAFAALINMLYFGGFIAINLAVMNLLPIPALDGGRVVCLLLTTAVEAITKKKVNPKFEGILHSVGMILLLGLMALILLKDVFAIFAG